MSITPAPFDRLYAVQSTRGTLIGLYTMESAERAARNREDGKPATIVPFSNTPPRPDSQPYASCYTPEGGYHSPALTRSGARHWCEDDKVVIATVYEAPICALWGANDTVDTGIIVGQGTYRSFTYQAAAPRYPLNALEAASLRAIWSGMQAMAQLANEHIDADSPFWRTITETIDASIEATMLHISRKPAPPLPV